MPLDSAARVSPHAVTSVSPVPLSWAVRAAGLGLDMPHHPAEGAPHLYRRAEAPRWAWQLLRLSPEVLEVALLRSIALRGAGYRGVAASHAGLAVLGTWVRVGSS